MNLTFDIAKRYLLGKKSTNAINIITWVSIAGLSIGTGALITILSVFNGFEGVLMSLFDSFNPEIKVSPLRGKYFSISDDQMKQLDAIPEISHISRSLEEFALMDYKGIQEVGIIKGVDDHYRQATDIDSSLVMGKFILNNGNIKHAILGMGLGNKLSINYDDALTPIDVFMPTIKSGGPLSKDYKSMSFYPTGMFSAGSDADLQYMVTHLDHVSSLLDLEDQYSYLEININEGASVKETQQKINQVMGSDFEVKDRFQQDETFFKVMNTEKWVAYVIACFILFIIAFNLVGSLWMLVLEKKLDLSILQAIGYTREKVRNLILCLGMMITGIGLISGIIIALIIYFLQKQYGMISIPDGFVIESYPIDLKWIDFIMVCITVLIIGFLASLLPALRAARISPYVRQEI